MDGEPDRQFSACRYETLPAPTKGPVTLFCKEDFREQLCRCPACFPHLAQHAQLLEEEETYEPPMSSDGSVNGDGDGPTPSRPRLPRTEQPGYAQALVGRIVARAEAMADQPFLGAKVPEYGDETIREVVEDPYRIIYRVAGTDVQAVAVIHSSRRMPRQPPT